MRLFLIAVVVLLVGAAPASAEPVLDRVQVGTPGNAATRGFAASLAVTLAVPGGYTRGCCYDFVSGRWAGPTWRASADPSAGEPSTIAWDVSFARGKALPALAKAAWTRFPQVSAAKRKVRHVIDGRTVGTLTGYTVLDAQPAPGAEVQAALAVDLGRRVTAVVKFGLADPPVDQDASFGALTVSGAPASQWNRRQAETAFASAYIEGLLPPARVNARVVGGQVKGKVTDQFGHLESTIPVVLKKGAKQVAAATTDRRGGFKLAAHGPGRYRVVATLSGTSATSKRLTVR